MKWAYAAIGLMFVFIVGGGVFLASSRGYSFTSDNNSTVPMTTMTLESPVFEENGSIPSKYTCDGENISPPLAISHVPEGAQSLVLVIDDPDIPAAVKESMGIQKFDHWVLYNIDPKTTEIKEGEAVGTRGLNTRGEPSYTGPCPPDAEHRYIFRLYALSGTLNFVKAPTLDEVEEAAKGMMLESATLTGRYERQ